MPDYENVEISLWIAGILLEGLNNQAKRGLL